MALEAVLAAGWGISAGYNKQRFTFDSAMSQRSAHYMQHMRIKQWHIFREDVRDLFTLTTAHLITYMTMGSLMLSWDARLTVFKGMNDMKDQPAWFFLFWSNCCLGAILFGFLGLWLVVHGALKSQAAAVQVLTQSVRPPIPSSQEVIAVGHDLAEYESLGAKKFFEVPNLFGWRDNGMHKTAVEKSERHGLENSHGILEATRAMTIVEEVEMGTSFKSSHETQKRAATVLNDARTGRPGQSAIFDKHIPIFHTMQRTFASYDAYARISVDVSVTFWLMAVGYYFISFTMAYEDSAALLSEHIVAAIFSWCGVAAMLSVGSVLMGLELFVSTRHAFWVNVFLQSGPLLGCLAVHLHVLERHGAVERFPVHINPATIALLSIVGHVSWMVSMMYQGLRQSTRGRQKFHSGTWKHVTQTGRMIGGVGSCGAGQLGQSDSTGSRAVPTTPWQSRGGTRSSPQLQLPAEPLPAESRPAERSHIRRQCPSPTQEGEGPCACSTSKHRCWWNSFERLRLRWRRGRLATRDVERRGQFQNRFTFGGRRTCWQQRASFRL